METFSQMGSFTSAAKISNGDTQDDDVTIPKEATPSYLLRLCHEQLLGRPPLLRRAFISRSPTQEQMQSPVIRVMQWNILSQALGQKNDNFVACPDDALDWSTRRYRILEEMLLYQPDILCLQEVDHFNFFQKMFRSVGYEGTFCPKPDSPCIYIQDNNGPDGCAVFYNADKFELVKVETRVLEVWHVQSNQVVILAILRLRATDNLVCVVTTHLKARQGTLLSTLRNEQGKDLVDFVKTNYLDCPLIVCGDFNAEPIEPVYQTLTSSENLNLSSCYTFLHNDGSEPAYTTWKIREDGEVCHTIDYIFYSAHNIQVAGLLQFPTEEEIGKGRVPSLQYPSDHFSLVADLMLPCRT